MEGAEYSRPLRSNLVIEAAFRGLGRGFAGPVAEGQALALTLVAFNTLVDEHGPALYRIAYRLVGDRHEAEDVVQETYRSAWKSRESYDSGRGDRAWLAAILRRRVIDRLRRHAPPQPFDASGPQAVGVAGADPFAHHTPDQLQ